MQKSPMGNPTQSSTRTQHLLAMLVLDGDHTVSSSQIHSLFQKWLSSMEPYLRSEQTSSSAIITGSLHPKRAQSKDLVFLTTRSTYQFEQSPTKVLSIAQIIPICHTSLEDVYRKKMLINMPYAQNNACIYLLNNLATIIKTSSFKRRGCFGRSPPLIPMKLQSMIDDCSTVLESLEFVSSVIRSPSYQQFIQVSLRMTNFAQWNRTNLQHV